jgi:hypothetical protein
VPAQKRSSRSGNERRPRSPSSAPPPAPPHLPRSIAALIAGCCILFLISFYLYDTDFWQHLLIGKVIWRLHSVPTTQLWRWPTWGAPDVNSSWGFQALIWPIWSLAGLPGVFVWRWVIALATFGVVWAVARLLHARGLAPLLVILIAALSYRQRSQVRPEALAGLLFVVQLWLLESRRHRHAPGAWWLVVVAWLWVNAHVSYVFGFLMLGIHLLDARFSSDPRRRAQVRSLWLAAAASLAVSFVNPAGWRAVWRPFEYAIVWRHEAIFQDIGELRALEWQRNWSNALPLLVVGWPLLLLWRWRRRRFDRAEAMTCGVFTTLLLSSQRFLAPYALAGAPYIARGLDEWLATHGRPVWLGNPWGRAAVVGALCVGLAGFEYAYHPEGRYGVGIDMTRFPVSACDFMAARGVRGRGFNYFPYGGYMLWRFWPDRTRLPFMSTRPEDALPLERDLYHRAFTDPSAWRDLDSRYHFDYALLRRDRRPLADFLDRDTTWALVFLDDAAALYVRRAGRLAPVAEQFAYRVLPGGYARLDRLGAAATEDSMLRARVETELRRQAQVSPVNATAYLWLAEFALFEQRPADARALATVALQVNPRTRGVHECLARVALREGRPRDALAHLVAERARDAHAPRLALLFGQSYEQLGDIQRARRYGLRALRDDPADAQARRLLERLEAVNPPR